MCSPSGSSVLGSGQLVLIKNRVQFLPLGLLSYEFVLIYISMLLHENLKSPAWLEKGLRTCSCGDTFRKAARFLTLRVLVLW